MYQIRKCETYSVTSKTETANLDPEKFRNISVPYEGNSEEEFLNYISDLYIDEVYEELDKETLEELDKKRAEMMEKSPSQSTMLTHNAALNRVFDESVIRGFLT
jgi:hypothetical protein